MKNPLSRVSLLWKILLSTSVAITLLFAVTGWIAVYSATQATSYSVEHEVQASFQAYQSLWKSRADRLASISSILSAMSDVRAAFGSADVATIRDTAGELWARVSDEEAFFLVASPRGQVIASLGGSSRQSLPSDLQVVRDSLSHFPAQASGFLARDDRLYDIVLTPVYVQSTGGTALLNVLVAGYNVGPGLAGRLKDATGGSEFLFFSGGRVIAATVGDGEADLIASQISGSPTRITAGGIQYAPLVTPLLDIDGHVVGQLAILRSFEAAQREISALRRNISLLWLVSMAAGLVLTYLLARRIVEPVEALDRAAAEVGRQNYDCEVPVKSEDELGRLAATFNAMCASIREAREELIRSERIGTIGRLATSIVHDLRNPLATIYGGAEMLLYSQLSEAQIHRLAGNMFGASQSIRELLQDLLDVGRGKAGEVRLCDLREIAGAVAGSLESAAAAQQVRIVLEMPEGLELPLDRRRIERVFLNLMGNALEAMPAGGAIAVSAAAEPDSVVVTVSDTGPGIAPEIRSRLFQPFVTAGKNTGLGLGLALARQAVVDHGGDMWADSSESGARFLFRLPRRRGHEDEAQPAVDET
jgi:signal transduction histidine kinase